VCQSGSSSTDSASRAKIPAATFASEETFSSILDNSHVFSFSKAFLSAQKARFAESANLCSAFP
jgi:hypothetical protein